MSNLSVVRLNGVDYNLEDENVRAMIAPTEASSTASAAHATGTYFILADTLYTATADIAIGDTIAVGTNCAAVPAGISNKLGNEVADLKSALGVDITTLGSRYNNSFVPKIDGTWSNLPHIAYRQYRVDTLPNGVLHGYSLLGAGFGVVFKDSDGTFISAVAPDNSTHIFTAPIPNNAVIAQIPFIKTSESDFHVEFHNVANVVYKYNDAIKKELLTENLEVVSIDQDDISFVSGYLSDISGTITSNANFITSEKIRCVPNSTVTYELIGYAGAVFVINVYDEYNQIINCVWPQGSGYLSVSGTLVLPDNAYYIQFSTGKTAYSISMQKYIEVNNDVVIENESTCLPHYTFEDGKYIDYSTGAVGSYANLRLSDYIEVSGGDRISYSLRGIKNYNACIAAYDENHNYSTVNSIWNQAGEGGSFGQIKGIYTVPNSVKYVRINTHKDVYYSSFQLIHETEKSPVEVIDTMRNQWKNKKWLAFGTSITDLRFINKETDEIVGKYVPYLADLSGLIVTERGKAGGALVGNILTEILNTDVSDYDIVTIEGFVNDFAVGSPIGDISDTGNTTFYGCLYQAVNYIQSHSHALVALIGDSTGREYTFQHDPSLIGHTVNYEYNRSKTVDGVTVYQSTYKDAMRKFADFAGCIFIDAGVESEINMNHPEYFADHLHHNDLGGKQFAQAIWNRLKQLNPLVLNE